MFESADSLPPGSRHVLLGGGPQGSPLSFPALTVYRDCLICYRTLRIFTVTSRAALLENYEDNALIIDAKGRIYKILHAPPKKRSLFNAVLGAMRVLVEIDREAEDVSTDYSLDIIKAKISESIRRDPIHIEQEDCESTAQIVTECNTVSEIVRYYCCGKR